MIDSALLTIIFTAALAGFFGGLKYYSNTLGSNPENFDMSKFAPIMIISIIVSVGTVLATSVVMSPDDIVNYLGINFILVVFANTIWSIILKKYSPS